MYITGRRYSEGVSEPHKLLAAELWVDFLFVQFCVCFVVVVWLVLIDVLTMTRYQSIPGWILQDNASVSAIPFIQEHHLWEVL